MSRSQAHERETALPPAPDSQTELIDEPAGDALVERGDDRPLRPVPIPEPEPELVPFPHDELVEPFATRGPVAHIKAVRALARAHGRRPRVHRKEFPEDGSFASLVAGGLIDERGRVTENGMAVAQAMTNAPVRIRVQASANRTPLVFEAHLFRGRALVLATLGPAQLMAHPGPAVPPGEPRPSPPVGLDMDSVSRLPVAIASWAGLQDSDAEPASRVVSATWDQVEAKFADDLPPTGLDAEIWGQPWTGIAISTEPSTSTLTVIRAGGHYYKLTRPNTDTARMSWLPPVAVWNEIVVLLGVAIPASV